MLWRMLMVDLDHVTYDLDRAVEKFCRRFGYPEADTNVWCYGFGEKGFAPIYNHMIRDGQMMTMGLIPGVVEALELFHRAGWQINFLTARKAIDGDEECTRIIQAETRKAMERDGLLKFGEVIFSPGNKSDYIRKHGCDIIIDDHPGTCFDCSKIPAIHGGMVRAFLRDCPHNKEGEYSDYQPRVACLSELPSLVLL
ncbi:MAG: hypothetical protein R3B38_02635 [Patescibacteria group bacterium]